MSAELPAAIERLVDFVNTVDVEDGTDEIDTATKLRGWFAAHELDPPARASAADLAAALRVRETLRASLRSKCGEDTGPASAELICIPLALEISPEGTAALMPAGTGFPAALGRLVAPLATAMADGTWERLKICPNDTCQYAFYDRSKNRSRRWCTMEICGNRDKTQAFRERHRGH